MSGRTASASSAQRRPAVRPRTAVKHRKAPERRTVFMLVPVAILSRMLDRARPGSEAAAPAPPALEPVPTR